MVDIYITVITISVICIILIVFAIRCFIEEARLKGRFQDKVLEVESYQRKFKDIQQRLEKAHNEFMSDNESTDFSRGVK